MRCACGAGAAAPLTATTSSPPPSGPGRSSAAAMWRGGYRSRWPLADPSLLVATRGHRPTTTATVCLFVSQCSKRSVKNHCKAPLQPPLLLFVCLFVCLFVSQCSSSSWWTSPYQGWTQGRQAEAVLFVRWKPTPPFAGCQGNLLFRGSHRLQTGCPVDHCPYWHPT